MERPKVLVTGIVSRDGLDELFTKCDVTYSETEYTRDWILQHIAAYDGVLLMGVKGDQDLLDAALKLKVISVNGVGFDHVDIQYAKARGIVVANSPQSVRVATAEMTFALLLSTAKRLHFYDRVVRTGHWIDVSKAEYQGMTLAGGTLGIFGMGRIGRTVAGYAQAFGMKVVYNDPLRMAPNAEAEAGVSYMGFDAMLETADIVSVHAPLTEATRGKFNDAAFDRMKPTAYLVNAARGPIIEERALVKALREHVIAGAGLDVFEAEPQVGEELRSLDNVVLSPHAGTGTVAARREIAQEAAGNLLSFFAGKPVHVVNP